MEREESSQKSGKQDEESECQPTVKRRNSFEFLPPYLPKDDGTEQNPGLRLVLVGKTGVGLRSMLSECGNRYHVFENNNLDDRRQVTDLLDKIEAMVKENGGGCYTNEMFREVERLLQEKEKELRRQYEEKLRQKEEELKARFEKDMEELKTDLEKKMEKLLDEGKERDLKIRTLEEKHKREVAEFERFYQEKGRAARDEAETLDFTHNFIFKMWDYVCGAMTKT